MITGTEAGLRLYLEEIVSLLGETITSQSWSTKAQAAAAMSSVASTLKERLGPPHLGHLLNTLLAGLSGRTWTGKEALLQAIDTVCTYCRSVDIVGQLYTVKVHRTGQLYTMYCNSRLIEQVSCIVIYQPITGPTVLRCGKGYMFVYHFREALQNESDKEQPTVATVITTSLLHKWGNYCDTL